MEFWNRGLSYVWSLDGTAPPPGRQAPGYVTPDAGPDGLLTGKSIPTGSAAGSRLHGRGQRISRSQGKELVRPQVQSVIKEDEFGFPIHKEVVAPAPWRLLRIDPPLRLASTPTGIEPDGWVTPTFGAPQDAPAFSAYNQFSTPGGKRGWIKIIVSRAGWQGTDKPGNVTIKVGRLVRGPTSSRRWGRSRRCCAGPCTRARRACSESTQGRRTRVELTIAPTFSPHDFGGGDRRRLGAQVSYGFEQQ